MEAALIVAASADAGFAEQVRATTRGLAIEIAPELLSGEQRPVLLVWSADLSATAPNVPALIELASRSRLVIARRDGTSLPAGLANLEALPHGASARAAAFRLLQATLSRGRASARPPVKAAIPPPAAAAPQPPVPSPAPPAPWRSAPWLVVVALVVVLIVGGVILGSLGL